MNPFLNHRLIAAATALLASAALAEPGPSAAPSTDPRPLLLIVADNDRDDAWMQIIQALEPHIEIRFLDTASTSDAAATAAAIAAMADARPERPIGLAISIASGAPIQRIWPRSNPEVATLPLPDASAELASVAALFNQFMDTQLAIESSCGRLTKI